MSAISREEEARIKEWQRRTGGCKDRVPTVQERIEANELEIAANLRLIREMTRSTEGDSHE